MPLWRMGQSRGGDTGVLGSGDTGLLGSGDTGLLGL